MKNGIFLLITICTVYAFSTLQSCKKTVDDNITTKVSDTTNVKYSTDIAPILAARCSKCHGKSSGSVIVLDNYTGLLAWTTNGYLVGTVTHAAGYVPMPYGEAKISDNEINLIVAWVHQGAKNN